MTFGEHLRKARISRGQTQLGAAAVLHIRPETLYRWEKGISQPDQDGQLPMIVAQYLGCSTKEVLDMLDGKAPKPIAIRRAELARLREEVSIAEKMLEDLGIPKDGSTLAHRIMVLATGRDDERSPNQA